MHGTQSEYETKRAPTRRVPEPPQPTTVTLNDRAANGQPHAETAGLCRKEVLEDFVDQWAQAIRDEAPGPSSNPD